MKTIRRLLGYFWILISPTAVALMFWQAFEKINLATEGVARTNTALQWGIILFIFIPICTGFALFGYYSLKGEYDKLPVNSDEL